ncbi:hypothetical protein SLEP1_g57661 [Rubroshorea leprosula]|uniref:Translation initiation factor eIF2B subunit gamma n=1 Tax=Rubroshorea leprosula TaxID=152421 RepID=A0AAV5MNJ8_9ROSI|nr:hypothetical protein SLEP1_g57661 [Rubroshorea leprosula]
MIVCEIIQIAGGASSRQHFEESRSSRLQGGSQSAASGGEPSRYLLHFGPSGAKSLKDLIVVVEGKDAALHVGGWISGAFFDRLHVEVAAVPEDVGTAGAIRAIAHHLTAEDIWVLSGDLVSDVPPGAVVA